MLVGMCVLWDTIVLMGHRLARSFHVVPEHFRQVWDWCLQRTARRAVVDRTVSFQGCLRCLDLVVRDSIAVEEHGVTSPMEATRREVFVPLVTSVLRERVCLFHVGQGHT